MKKASQIMASMTFQETLPNGFMTGISQSTTCFRPKKARKVPKKDNTKLYVEETGETPLIMST